MSDQYQPPGSSKQSGIGKTAKIVIAAAVVGVLALLIAVGIGANTLIERWDEVTAAAGSDDGSDQESHGSTSGEFGSENGEGQGEKSGEKVTAKEVFDGGEHENLKLTYNEHTAHAKRLGRWDHDDCSGAGGGKIRAILEEHGCEYRVEQALAGRDGPFWVGNQVLAFPDKRSAKAAAKELDKQSKQIQFRVKNFDEDPYEHSTNVDPTEARFVVASTIIFDPSDEQARSESVQDDVNTTIVMTHGDLRAYFIWR